LKTKTGGAAALHLGGDNMENAKFYFQAWKVPEEEAFGNYIENIESEKVKVGSGNAQTLKGFAEIVKQNHIDSTVLGWTVWSEETKECLEFRGSKLIYQGLVRQ
jgi:hypothetical protein